MDGKVEFTRVVPRSDSREIWADGGKWKELFFLIQKGKAEGATTLVVSSAEMLGDTWRELILNMTAIASAGLTIEIQPPVAHAVTRCEVDFSSGEEKELLVREVFEKKGPLMANGDTPEPVKNGPFVFRVGNMPAIILDSQGPDETYCQAELLLKRDWEEYKPSSKGRQIEGFYVITGGTIEWFLHQHAGRDAQGAIEDYRRKILAGGWSQFYLGTSYAPQEVSAEEARRLSYALHPGNQSLSAKDMRTAKAIVKVAKKLKNR